MKTFLVTGVTGFLAQALVERLLKEGHRVVGVGRREKGFLSDAVMQNERFLFVQGDLLQLSPEGYGPWSIDGIFHLASQQPSSPEIRYEMYYQGNVLTTRRIIELAKERAVPFICYVSTTSVFGLPPPVLREGMAPQPIHYYGLTKYFAERILEIELKKTIIQTVVVRFPSLFGKNHRSGLVYTFYQQAKAGQIIEVWGGGGTYRNVLSEDEAATFLQHVAENVQRLAHYEVIMAGSSNSLTTLELAQYMKELLLSHADIVVVGTRADDQDIVIDNAKARRLVGFNPCPVKESLRRYIEDMKNS